MRIVGREISFIRFFYFGRRLKVVFCAYVLGSFVFLFRICFGVLNSFKVSFYFAFRFLVRFFFRRCVFGSVYLGIRFLGIKWRGRRARYRIVGGLRFGLG